jgi:hypothetical protein
MDGLAPPSAPQMQSQPQPSNDTLSRGRKRGNEADLQYSAPTKSISQSQAQAHPKLKMSTNQPQLSSGFENRARHTSAAQPVAKSPVQIPSAPPFSSIKFAKIGQQPELLKRFSDFGPDSGAIYEFSHDDHQSASPESTTVASTSVAASGATSRLELRLGRPSLLQALGGSDIDADMDVDPSLSSTDPAAHPNGATHSHSQVHTKNTSAGHRHAWSGSQSKGNNSDSSNSNGKCHGAISIITNLSNSANPDNLTSSVNGNGRTRQVIPTT